MQNQIIASQIENPIPAPVYIDLEFERSENPFSGVVGHEKQKKELLNVLDWFKRSSELRAKGVTVPKGIILFGKPGNGKSLLMKGIIENAGLPVFVYRGEGVSTVEEGIVELFNKAKQVDKALIVMDELDLLIDDDKRVTRVLQENLDGVASNDNILVLAATNDIYDIPDAILRSGRLEKRISIDKPSEEECISMLKMALGEFDLSFPEDADEHEVAAMISGSSFADIKAIANDVVLRNGFGPITCEMLDESIYSITGKTVESDEGLDYIDIATHEAGHAVAAAAYREYFNLATLTIRSASGELRVTDVEKGFWPYAKVIADIRICMAGIIAQRIICGRGSRGSENDLQRARRDAYNLFNAAGYSTCWETLPPAGERGAREETQKKRRRMESKIERFLKKQERATTRYVKKHRDEIERLGRLLYEKKRLKPSEILYCIRNAS